MKEYYHIGEISKLYHIGIDSLRYYEKLGIIKPTRSESGYRLYSIHDIWRLNVIRELRELGFSMDYIKTYFEFHNVKNTYEMLEEEEKAIKEKLKSLKDLQNNVKNRLAILKEAQSLVDLEIKVKSFPLRKCFSISESYQNEYQMDVLIKRLLNIEKEYFYIIGNNKIGTAIYLDKYLNENKLSYDKVFILSDDGNKSLKAGKYLSITYKGSYKRSKEALDKLINYAKDNHLELDNLVLEILWVEIHTTLEIKEYVTELQVLIKE